MAGDHKNGAPDAIVTSTITDGKGFRHVDLQATFGFGLPTDRNRTS
jgi:hypothetical protein